MTMPQTKDTRFTPWHQCGCHEGQIFHRYGPEPLDVEPDGPCGCACHALIAAASDMHAALKRAEARLEDLADTDVEGSPLWSIRAALAKATKAEGMVS